MTHIGLILHFLELTGYTCNCYDAKHSNGNNFICVQDIDTTFACIVGFSGSANSNTLSKMSREPRELPWQPNLDKNKPKLHRLQFCAKNRGLFFRTSSKVFGVGEFKYVKGAKGVAMATKFVQK